MCYTAIFISISEYSNSETMVHIGFFEFFLGVLVFFMTKDCREYFKVSIHWMIGIIITNVVYFYLFYKNVSDDSAERTDMQYCVYCGEKIPTDSCYCVKCGRKVPQDK